MPPRNKDENQPGLAGEIGVGGKNMEFATMDPSGNSAGILTVRNGNLFKS